MSYSCYGQVMMRRGLDLTKESSEKLLAGCVVNINIHIK
jgi:hypothetical protein